MDRRKRILRKLGTFARGSRRAGGSGPEQRVRVDLARSSRSPERGLRAVLPRQEDPAAGPCGRAHPQRLRGSRIRRHGPEGPRLAPVVGPDPRGLRGQLQPGRHPSRRRQRAASGQHERRELDAWMAPVHPRGREALRQVVPVASHEPRRRRHDQHPRRRGPLAAARQARRKAPAGRGNSETVGLVRRQGLHPLQLVAPVSEDGQRMGAGAYGSTGRVRPACRKREGVPGLRPLLLQDRHVRADTPVAQRAGRPRTRRFRRRLDRWNSRRTTRGTPHAISRR